MVGMLLCTLGLQGEGCPGQRASWRTVGAGDGVESIKLSALHWWLWTYDFVLMLG